jgi:transcriptional regulator with XRE-family HTH domain/Tfp pilus assembly protein PilF
MDGRILISPRTPQRATSGLGARLRQLRVAAALTQSELAGDRFSKEYLSQIERGKTRPTAETLAWIAERLGVDASYLQSGQKWNEYAEVEAAVTRAEAAVEGQQYDEALATLEGLQYSPEAPEVEFRALLAESWARMYHGELRPALELLVRARELSEMGGFSDVERADVLYRMGVCRYKLTSINTAQTLFSEALQLADRSGVPCDRLRSHILEWRSRCSRRQRDFEAAREDIERALELAERLDDSLTVAHVTFQASIVAERDGQWLRARTLAERAKELYEAHGDRLNLGRMLNNLGGLNFLLGKPEDAIAYLKRAFSVALEVGSEADAAQAVSSLAQVHLGAGDWGLAEEQARHALTLLEGRADFLDEIGNTQIVLGRALLEQDRLDEAQHAFAEGELSLAQLSSASHRAVAWTAQGDLASRRGDDSAAAALYRRAAEALQDVRF